MKHSRRIRRIIHAIPQVLLVFAVLFLLAGALSNRHGYYYPSLLCLMLSNTMFLFVGSLHLGSKNGFVLSLFNLMICFALALQFVSVHFPVLAPSGWHLGLVIVLLYAADIALYIHFFKGKMKIDRGTILPAAVFIAGPVLAAILFYGGVPSWIGLSAIVVADLISVFAARRLQEKPTS